MRDYPVLRRTHAVIGEVEIRLRVLRERDFPYYVRTLVVLREMEQLTQRVQEITRRLYLECELQIRAVRQTRVEGRERTRITPVHDEMVLVTRFEHRRAVDEIFLELLRHPRDVDIVDIHEVELMRPAAARVTRH